MKIHVCTRPHSVKYYYGYQNAISKFQLTYLRSVANYFEIPTYLHSLANVVDSTYVKQAKTKFPIHLQTFNIQFYLMGLKNNYKFITMIIVLILIKKDVVGTSSEIVYR